MMNECFIYNKVELEGLGFWIEPLPSPPLPSPPLPPPPKKDLMSVAIRRVILHLSNLINLFGLSLLSVNIYKDSKSKQVKVETGKEKEKKNSIDPKYTNE